MALSHISNPAAVLAAIAEHQRVGREAFLKKYGFGHARDYFLIHDGQRFDSKAVVGAAHGYQFPEAGPLRSKDFSGGAATVVPKLRELGFEVEESTPDEQEAGEGRASELLRAGEVYTREDLKRILDTQDATINTGIFKPAGFSSVLLFITKDKPKDRTQYVDSLEGDVLHWQGQSAGLKDALVVEHRQRDLEVLVFYRDEKYEHAGAGFRYEGPFDYVSHTGAGPATFVLHRQSPGLAEAASAAEGAGAFDPTDQADARKKTLAAIVRRQGQPAFRRQLLRAYGGRCAVTDCALPEVLEAAHIIPYKGPQTNHVSNGLLLRADLHTLFDLGLVAVDEGTGSLVVAGALRLTDYGQLHGKKLRVPKAPSDRPSAEALRLHRQEAGL